ncbi:hypothetical protein EB118_18200 [bacterium]|nr:hypothetical protein [Pseudomonadota bacterium]NDD04201.1 hypothetical protein [Pseudomonadota bacterium]NDG31992.1 hypothetical protein [bacterium]
MKNTKPAHTAKKTLDFDTDIVGRLFNNSNFGYELEYFLVPQGAEPLAAGAVLSGRDVMAAIEEAADWLRVKRVFSKELKAARALLLNRGCRVVLA